MRPPARPNRYFFHPLDAVLGTAAAVRILRMLSLAGHEVAPMRIAARCSLGRTGTWKALRRLCAAGIVEPFGGYTGFPDYRLVVFHPLAKAISELFARERYAGAATARSPGSSPRSGAGPDW